jgi:hypothetical protein
MSARTQRFLIAALVALGAPALVHAQWITFTDSTPSYLSYTGYATDGEEKDFSTADLDKDGDLDVIVVRKQPFYQISPRTHVLLMNVGGVLTDQTVTYAPGFIANPSLARLSLVADFDGDTWLDVIVVNTNSQSTSNNTGFMPQYYKNLGNSGSTWLGLQLETGRIPSFSPEPLFCSGAFGDADGDGDQDVFLGDYNNLLEDRLIINDGTGHFTDQTATRLPGNSSGFSVEATFADVESDGDLDIIESLGTPGVGVGSPAIRIHVNNGSGIFSTQTVNSSTTIYFSAVGDLNNDNKVDIYVGRDNQDQYMLNTSPIGGPISFSTVTLLSTPNPKTAVFSGNGLIVDMDNDGDKDFVMANADADVDTCASPGSLNDAAVVLRNGTIGGGQTQVLVDPWGNPNVYLNIHNLATHDIAVLDLNSDGLLDMLYGNCTGYQVFIQNGQPFSLQVTEPFPTALLLTVQNGAPNFTTYGLLSTVPLAPAGSGPFFGLHESALNTFIGLYPIGDPFVFQTDASGDHTFSFPGGIPTPFPTQWRAVQLTGPTGYSLTNIVTITF